MVDVDEFLIPFTQPSHSEELPSLPKFLSNYEEGKAIQSGSSKKGVQSSTSSQGG